MNKLLKKITAAAVTAAILSSGVIMPVFAYDTTVNVSFDSNADSSYTLSQGAQLKDGRNEKAVSCTGNADSYVTLNSDLSSVNGAYTISVWCKPDNSTMWTRVYDFGTGTDKYIFLAPSSSFGEGLPRFVLKNGGAEEVLMSEKPLNIGEWNNITVTYDGTTATMYVNGFNAGKTTDIKLKPSDIGATDKNYLGKSQYDVDPYFSGMIDDFAVYSGAMTEAEVQELAAEAYQNEVARLAAKDDKYIIETDFYNEAGEKIFTAEKGASVTAKVTVKNHTTENANINVSLILADKSSSRNESAEIGVAQEHVFEIDQILSTTSSEMQVIVMDNNTKQRFESAVLPIGSKVEFPKNVPFDKDDTVYPEGTLTTETYGAHDPTIFKDPVGGHYWAYSSHNLVFESEDLINWTKHDYTKTISVPESAKTFINKNYTGTTVNGTYWAPDILYVEGDEYPYWFYLSVSCGLGGRNSVIVLVKSKTPGLWDGEYQDCGVVLASKENSSYKTNAIDANIYTDTDGKNYFIWGSFWKGLQYAPLKEDGTVEGVNYTSDATILSSCQNFGTSVFTVKNGIAGPEGPFTVNNTEAGHRYMFVSYGWLGTNYNVRIARMPLSTPMSQATSTSFTDHNGKQVGTAQDSGNAKDLWGYKLIGSYQLGDGITYYGNGHNSVINDNGDWYLVEHCRKVADATAYLQVRKMLWTPDGWPVVSPMVYGGEKVQKIDDPALLYGTWDLASVGHSLYNSSVTGSKDSDLPVKSSEVVLKPDGTLGGGIGTWSFDGNYTVTLKFTKNGDDSDYEFYKNGDTMTMYVMAAYDRDKAENTLVMTGVDQKHITQFARKANANYTDTTPEPYKTTAVSIPKSVGGNPILGYDQNGNVVYGGDPAATVIGDTVYLYVGHDTAPGESYVIPNYALYTSKDMTSWEYKGEVMNMKDVSWASNTTSAWASQMIEHNGKYYLYFCTWDKTDSGKQSIGVAVADSPEGPFVDSGAPLVKGSVTSPQSSDWNDIDPTVWVETVNGEEHRYLGWGNGKYYICELNEDMVSVKDLNGDGVINNDDIKLQKINNMGSDVFTEAPWLYKRGNKYYTFFAANWREKMAYAIADSPFGPWSYGGTIMMPTATSNTNHPSIIDFNGRTYFIYHNGSLPQGSGYRRVVCVEEMFFDNEGLVLPITESSTGLNGTKNTLVSASGKYLAHEKFENPADDASYPLTKKVKASEKEDFWDTAWEIVTAQYPGKNENLVSIEAVNKPGLYLADVDGELVLTQNADGNMDIQMTFKTVEGLSGNGTVSFESLSSPGKYITLSGDTAFLSYGRNTANCSFATGDVAPTPVPTAAPLPTPTPVPPLTPDVNNNFDSMSAGTLISIQTTDQDPVSIDGGLLYVGTRGGGPDTTSNWAIEAGGISENALVLNSGKFVSANRGPRFAPKTPTIINNSTVSLSVMVKGSADGVTLYYGDEISSQGTKTCALSSSEWKEFKTEITNTEGEITRTIYYDGAAVSTDAVETFPVLWGTDVNEKYTKIYFDDLSIKTKAPAAVGKLDVSGQNISVTMESGKGVVYAVDYDGNGCLADVQIFNVEGQKEFTAEFIPDIVYLWDENMAPLDIVKNSQEIEAATLMALGIIPKDGFESEKALSKDKLGEWINSAFQKDIAFPGELTVTGEELIKQVLDAMNYTAECEAEGYLTTAARSGLVENADEFAANNAVTEGQAAKLLMKAVTTPMYVYDSESKSDKKMDGTGTYYKTALTEYHGVSIAEGKITSTSADNPALADGEVIFDVEYSRRFDDLYFKKDENYGESQRYKMNMDTAAADANIGKYLRIYAKKNNNGDWEIITFNQPTDAEAPLIKPGEGNTDAVSLLMSLGIIPVDDFLPDAIMDPYEAEEWLRNAFLEYSVTPFTEAVEPATGEKLFKMLLDAMNYTSECAESDYLTVAQKYDMASGISGFEPEAAITKENAAVLFVNAMNMPLYVYTPDGYKKMDGTGTYYESAFTEYHDIFTAEGSVIETSKENSQLNDNGVTFDINYSVRFDDLYFKRDEDYGPSQQYKMSIGNTDADKHLNENAEVYVKQNENSFEIALFKAIK